MRLMSTAAASTDRMVSLDVFRGITIAGMILVNNPGTWSSVYEPLKHAEWNGWTPTDFIFPFFLLIMGVAMTFSFQHRTGEGTRKLLGHILSRATVLFLLGIILAAFPGSSDPKWPIILPSVGMIAGLELWLNGRSAHKIAGLALVIVAFLGFVWNWTYIQTAEPLIRIPGVLQRIAFCYLFVSLIMLFCSSARSLLFWTIFLFVAYWILAKGISAPADYDPSGVKPEALLHDWLDVKIFGNLLYKQRPDPEGILGTFSALSTTLIGVLCGYWLLSSRSREYKLVGMFAIGNVLLIAGIFMDYSFPINKTLWSSSYVLFTGGMALHFLAMCLWFIDDLGYKKWAYPFLVFGTNPILVFFLSGLMARFLLWIQIEETPAKQWIYENWFSAEPTAFSSMVFALSYVALWVILTLPLYRRKIWVKI